MNGKQVLVWCFLCFCFGVVFSQEEEPKTYKETIEGRSSNKKSSMSEEDMAILNKGAEEIAASLKEPGLKVGDLAPDFELINVDGEKIKLTEVLKNGPVVLS